jgi:hypothetical protein
MRAVYAVALVAGSLGVMAWVVMAAVAGSVAGRESADPESRFGERARSVVAALFGFGMAGISASYGGWPWPLALIAAVAAAAGLAAVARMLVARGSEAA